MSQSEANGRTLNWARAVIEMDAEGDNISLAAKVVLQSLDALRSELEACNAEWNERYQRMLATEEALRAEIKGLRGFKNSVDEALNTGNGTYKP